MRHVSKDVIMIAMATILHLVLLLAQLHLPACALTKNHAARNVVCDLESNAPKQLPCAACTLMAKGGLKCFVLRAS